MTASGNQIVVYQPNETVRLDVRLDGDTVWLTQSQMATLFGCSSDNIGLHLKNVYMDRRFAKTEADVTDLKAKVDFFVQTKEPPLRSIFYQNKFWNAKSLLIKFIRRGEDGGGDHPRASRFNPQGDIGAAGIRQGQEGGVRGAV